MKKIVVLLILLLMASPVMAQEKVVNMKPKTPKEWQTYLNFRRDETLNTLYAISPEARYVIENAEGYAVFTNFSLKIFVAGGGSGRGVLHDNKTGEDIFMRMVRAHAGFGIGIKDFRVVFTFDDRAAMEYFINSGWSFGTEADVAVKGFDSGAEKSGAIRVAPGIKVYQLTENGLALEVNLTGTKYWKDKRVNNN